MKRFCLALACASAFFLQANAQTAARYDMPTLTTTPAQVPFGTLPNLLAVPNAVVAICGFPATANGSALPPNAGIMCTNKITTYTDSTAGTVCPPIAQITAPGSSVCVSTSGSQGVFGFWYDAATQTHMTYTVKTAWGTFGPYEIDPPVGGGSGSPGGSTGSLQYNNAGVFGGLSGTCLPKLNGTSAPSCAVAGTDYLQSINSTLVLAALGYTPIPNTLTINGHALSANVIISASDLTTGTLPHAQLPTLVSGDVTSALGFTPLNPANNLSDVASASTALSNLGAQPSLGFTPVPNTRTVNGHALSANITVTASDVGLGNVTNDAQTKASIVPNTVPSAGQVCVGNAGGTACAQVSISGDATLGSTGALSVTKSGGTPFGTGAFATIANYAPLVSPSFTTPSLGVATATSINSTSIPASATLTQTICSGTLSIPATAVSSANHLTYTATCTGAVVGDNVAIDFDGGADPITLTGFIPSTSGILTIYKRITSNTVNVELVNNTAASITPTAFTLDYRVTR